MNNDNPRVNASATVQRLLVDAVSGATKPATKEDLARLYSILIHLRDIVVTQASILAQMPLTPDQISNFTEENMPLNSFQEALGDGITELLISIEGEANG